MFAFLFLFIVYLTVIDGKKPIVIYSNDQGVPPIGECDGDNPQIFIHFLYYVNDIDLRLIIPSGATNCVQNGQSIIEIYDILNAYQKDYDKLNSSSIANGGDPYPTYKYLKSITIQGCNQSAPYIGYPPYPLEASNRIIEIVDNLNDDEIVWYGAGGGLCELARALHDKPSIAQKIKVYYNGHWNTKQDPYARNYVFNNFPDLFFIEANTTTWGWWNGGNQTGIYNNTQYDIDIISKSGNLGKYYYSIIPSQFKVATFQESDGPCYFYYIDRQHQDRNLSDPTIQNWGGQFSQIYAERAMYFSDNNISYGWHSVNQWRVNGSSGYMNDWMDRLKWLY